MPDTLLPIVLVPLDERPVNTRYPQQLGAIAGAEVRLPPVEIRGQGREGSNQEAVTTWLTEAAQGAGGVVASIEYLAYGNLINARISGESAADCLPRLSVLERIGQAGTPVYAFSLITRVSNADDSVEEPLYWSEYGTRFYQLSGLLHQREVDGSLSVVDARKLSTLQAALPGELVTDWLQRRLRNHTVNLALLDLLARERLAFLLITSDDTSPFGMPSREKGWLEGWLNLLGPKVQSHTMMHPGADEVGSALVARLICAGKNWTPRICPIYAVPGGEEIVAPYEDRAVKITVEGQIRACGGVLAKTPEESDIILAVFPPSPRRTEFKESFAESERHERESAYRTFLDTLARYQAAGKPIAIGDVTYPNGSDPLLIELLLAPDCPLNLTNLAAYGAWNTAGNTLGVVVAQAIVSQFVGENPARKKAQKTFLAHRFLEDWGYQAVVRKSAREQITARFGHRDPDPNSEEQQSAACAVIEEGLREALSHLQRRGIGRKLALVPGSVRLPWKRTFEVDFDLE